MIPKIATFLTLMVLTAGTNLSAQQTSTPLLDWEANRLTIYSNRIPTGNLQVWYLEAFCKRGSTLRKWEETVIPHKTERLGGTGKTTRIRLRTTLLEGVEVLHELRAVKTGVALSMTLKNNNKFGVDVDWAQPCIQVAGFTGRNQETYVDRCFLFVGDPKQPEYKRLSELPRTEEALYKGGQVFVPMGIDKNDVNPRPISTIVPALSLIGCLSSDGSSLLATAWDNTQELFQGVITCIHADTRIGGLKAGETKRLRGKIYLMDAEVDALLKQYRRDFPMNRRK